MEESDARADRVESNGSSNGTPAGMARVEILRLVVAVVIVAVWAIIYLRAAVDSGFSPPAELSGVMLLVVAWLFGSTALKGTK